MTDIIKVQAPDGHIVTVELRGNMFFIGESMFLFTDMEDLIKTAKKHKNDRGTDTEPMRNVVANDTPE